MVGLLVNAGILGVIIAIMEEGDFPGWFSMMACVLAAVFPAALINAMIPPSLFFVGLVGGAVCAGFAISALCGMSVKRASIAAGIYLVVSTLISLGMGSAMF